METLLIGTNPDDVKCRCGKISTKARKERQEVSAHALTGGWISGYSIQEKAEMSHVVQPVSIKRLSVCNFQNSKTHVIDYVVNRREYFIKQKNPRLILTQYAFMSC